MALLFVLLGITAALANRRTLKTGVIERGSTCAKYKDCESCTKGFGKRPHYGATCECVWRNGDCRSKKGHRADGWVQSHPLGAFCPSYMEQLSKQGETTMSKLDVDSANFPAWLGVLPAGTIFKYALLRHEKADPIAKGLGVFGYNSPLNTYMRWGKRSKDPTNIARVNALSNMFGGFQRLAKTDTGSGSMGQKRLSVDVSPIRRALQTLEVTLNRTLLNDITEEFPIRVDALLREASAFPSGWPGSTKETKQIFCDMFSGLFATISMEQMIKPESILLEQVISASTQDSASSSALMTAASTGLVCPSAASLKQSKASQLLASQRVENRTFTFKQEFSQKHGVEFLPPASEEENDLKGEDDDVLDLRALYLSKFASLPEKEGTLFIGHGGMFKRVMRQLWEQDKTAVDKFRGVLDSRGTNVIHLGFGQSYLLLDIPGEGERWVIIDREGGVVRGD